MYHKNRKFHVYTQFLATFVLHVVKISIISILKRLVIHSRYSPGGEPWGRRGGRRAGGPEGWVSAWRPSCGDLAIGRAEGEYTLAAAPGLQSYML